MLPNLGNAFLGEEHQTLNWHNNQSKAALLIHGFPGTPAEMTPVAMQLHESGWAVCAPLLPGFGQDIDQIGNYAYQHWVEALGKHLNRLQQEHDRTIIVGYSMGGALAMQLAATHPIQGLALFSPFWQMNHFIWHLVPIFKRLFPQVKPFKLFRLSLDDPEMRKSIQEWMPDINLDDTETQKQIIEMTIPLNIFDQIRIAGKRAYQSARQIQSPTLVIQGTQDVVVPAAMTRRMLNRIASAVHYVEVNAAHDLIDPFAPHWPHATKHLSDFAQTISNEART